MDPEHWEEGTCRKELGNGRGSCKEGGGIIKPPQNSDTGRNGLAADYHLAILQISAMARKSSTRFHENVRQLGGMGMGEGF
jgi:hypothetical protein